VSTVTLIDDVTKYKLAFRALPYTVKVNSVDSLTITWTLLINKDGINA